MDRERLNALLKEPTRVDGSDVTGLRELASRYPWFSGAQVLLTVGEAASGGLLYDEHLRTAAAHLPSRARVYDLVHADAGPAPRRRPTPVDAGPLAVPVAPELPLPPPASPIEAAPAEGPTGVEQGSERTVQEELQAAAPSAEGPEQRIPGAQATTALPASPHQDPSPAPRPVDELDELVRTAAVAGAYDLTWATVPDAAPPEPPSTAPEVPAGDAVASPPEATAVPSLPQGPVRSDRMRFTAWLEQTDTPERPATAAPAGPVAPTRRSAPPPGKEATEVDVRALIDRFIQGQAPAPARKAEFFTPQQAAKRSLEEHAELVTETLARIYEQQGDAARAAAAYRRLAERHPQRKEEFLGRARALERGKA